MLRKLAFSVLTLVLVLSTVSTSLAAQPQAQQPSLSHPAKTPQAIPQEIRDLFKDMTVEKFLALNKGPVPHALDSFAPPKSAVYIVEMAQAPLAVLYAEQEKSGTKMAALDQKSYINTLEQAQAPVVTGLKTLGGQVIDHYTRAYNGILVKLPSGQVDAAGKLPGVKSIRLAPTHTLDLSHSVPLINAPEVWADLGARGEGVTIAVIDSGIDYTHAALGGSGNPADYANNNHQIIEPGTFPTAKVIGGWDFAGPTYDAGDPANDVPQPDPDPIDGDGHGTHVSSTAAGIGVPGVIGEGVAPAASLYALKVFGEPAGSTNLTVSAIEWAMDPNHDGDVSDHVDVINMSLGSNFGPASPEDPDIVASNNASAIGVVVAAASGNAGNVSYITSSPAAAGRAISVAASSTGWVTGPTIDVTDMPTITTIIYQPPAFDNNTGHFNVEVTAPLIWAGAVTTTNDLLCSTAGIAPNAMLGKVALIQRGGTNCGFTLKVNNAAALGAVGAIIYNSAAGGNSMLTMIGTPVNIPAGFIFRTDGLNLKKANGHQVVVSAESDVTVVPDVYVPADSIAGFSARGPRSFDSFLKPEITAPGVSIFAAKMGSGTLGTSMGGTSMATPHIAGVAALLREVHPDWTVEQIKAAMMNTAVDLVTGSVVPLQGAGRVDAFAAASTPAVAVGDGGLASLSWGLIQIGQASYTDVKWITLDSATDVTQTCSTSWEFGAGSLTAGFELTLPAAVTVAPAPNAAAVPVALSIDPAQVPMHYRYDPGGPYALEEYYGYVGLSCTGESTEDLRVPFYAVVRPYSRIDLDTSEATTLSGLVGVHNSGPVASSLWAYPAYFSGDNEPLQADAADLRLVGMDYGWNDPDLGDIFVPAIDVWGPWSTPQPYIAEFDLYLDVNEDATFEYLDFNFNYSWLTGGTGDDQWIPLQVDLAAGTISLASGYYIYTDYDNGYMEWYLPATWNGLDDVGPGANTDLVWGLVAWAYPGTHSDGTDTYYFDLARPFLAWRTSGNPGPASRDALFDYEITDWSAYAAMNPLGIMVVDYNGQPGEGQAELVPLPSFQYSVYLPVTYKAAP